jgi:hypothetical protein
VASVTNEARVSHKFLSQFLFLGLLKLMGSNSRNGFTTHDLVCKAFQNYPKANYGQFEHLFT